MLIHHDNVYICSSQTAELTTTLLPPAVNVDTTSGSALKARSDDSVEVTKQYFFQAGYRNVDGFEYTEKIMLNDQVTENVWHRLSLILNKTSNQTVQIFFDNGYVGSFRESLAARDVGGVMTLNLNENEVMFKSFIVGRCKRFDSRGECKHGFILFYNIIENKTHTTSASFLHFFMRIHFCYRC